MSDRRYEPRVKMSRRRFWAVFVFCLLLFLSVLAVMTPMVMKCQKKAPMITTVSNAKQIFLLLVEFDQDYGEFPSDKTAGMIRPIQGYENDPNNGYASGMQMTEEEMKSFHGNYSNDYLGQFIAAGYVQSEEIFSAKGGSAIKKRPDNDISSREKILEAGECGFAYVKGMNTVDFHADSPILMNPMYGDKYRFNPSTYQGKGVVLTLNGSARSYRIDSNHHLKRGDGKTLFEGGKDTVWGDKGFDSANLCYANIHTLTVNLSKKM